MKSLKNDITNYLRVASPEWRTKDAIEKFAQEKGYLADNAARRARELTESGMIIKDPESKYTRYRYNIEEYPMKFEGYSRHNRRSKQAKLICD